MQNGQLEEGIGEIVPNVLAFDVTAQAALLALSDGDAVSLAGTLTLKVWTNRDGQPRPALGLLASQVLRAYQEWFQRKAGTERAGLTLKSLSYDRRKH